MAELVCRADDPRWLALRRTGVTATDLPAILGLTRYDSLYACWWRKRDGLESAAENDRLMLGSVLESYIAERWMNARQVPLTHRAGAHSALYRSADRPWQLATPDRLFYDEPVEFKSWGTTDGWGDDGTDLVPLQVRAQVLWQMDTLGAARGHVGCVFLPSGEFRSYVLAHDHTLGTLDLEVLPVHAPASLITIRTCQLCADIDAMRTAALAFWESVQAGESPSPDGSLASLAMLKARFGLSGERKDTEIPKALRDDWQAAARLEAEFHARKKEREAEIRELAGDATHYAVDGEVFARRESFESSVKAHTRKVDRLMPVKPRKDDNELSVLRALR